MAKVVIEGHRFDTKKAKIRFDLQYFDGNNSHTGKLYCSSTGVWYVYTPSQWSNQHAWEVIDPTEALERYDRYLTDEHKEKIAALAGLEWE